MDPAHFSGKEIIEMAVRIEENGLAFYKEAREAAKTVELKELFSYLSSEEEKHIDYFKGLFELVKDEAVHNLFDPYLEEEALYMRALVDSSLFINTDKERLTASALDDEERVLSLAIEMEKDSVLFYQGLADMVREKDKPVVRDIIAEERKHIASLNKLRGKLK